MGRIKASNTHSQHCVQVKLELGHKATIRAKPTPEGFTHDWTVFVRGPEGSNIQHFVEKVVFLLHESFHKPKRVVKEPPYQVSESGYAGFVLPIEIYFKNKEEPKKVCFDYDLFLHIEGPPVNHIRCEKLTFQNPTEDFRRKLLKSGGVGVVGSEGGTVLGQQQQPSEPFTEIFGPPLTKPKSSPEPTRKHKSSSKEISKSSSSSSHQKPQPPPPPGAQSETFVNLFGPSIKTNKASPDPSKLKDPSKTVGSKSSKSLSSSSSSVASGSSNKEPKISISKDADTKTVAKIKDSKLVNSKEKEFKSLTKSGNKDAKIANKEKDNKLITKISKAPVKKPPVSPSPPPPSSNSNDSECLISKENKLAMKRPISPLSPKPEKPSELKKRKRNSSSSESLSKPKEKHHIEKRPKKPKEIPKKENTERKEKHKSSNDKPRKFKKSDFELPEPRSFPDDEIKPIKKSSSHSDISKDYHSSASRDSHTEKSHSSNDCQHSPISSPDASPSSSISFSSLQTGRKHGPLTALMAELDDQDDDDELVSPLSSDPPSPPNFTTKEEPAPPPPPPSPVVPPKCSQPPPKPDKSKHESRKSKKTSRSGSESRSNDSRTEAEITTSKSSNFSPEELEELVSIQHQIWTTGNDDLLQRIVDLIEESGLYTVTNTTFDFDLCTLDKDTVRKIQGYIDTNAKKLECY